MKEQLENLRIGLVKQDVNVEEFTTFKLPAKASFLVLPDSVEHLLVLLKFLKEKQMKYKVIGKGSNLIFVGNYQGVLIRLDALNHVKIEKNKISVGAGYSLMALSHHLSNMGYTGLEFASGIPGSVGGSLVNNAGAYEREMADIVVGAKILTPTYEIVSYTKEDMVFSYRRSNLQFKQDYICLEVEIALEKGDKKTIQESIQRRREKRVLSQPLEYPSAGSTFRNPFPLYAGKIIEELGFKGVCVGDACVSEKHANFIINKGHATGSEVKKLIFMIKEKVKEEYGIDLVCEQEFVE